MSTVWKGGFRFESMIIAMLNYGRPEVRKHETSASPAGLVEWDLQIVDYRKRRTKKAEALEQKKKRKQSRA